MNIRNQIARLKQTAGDSQFSSNVRQISQLMDELSAEAVGGAAVTGEVSLLETFNASTSSVCPTPPPNNPKVTQ
ncbi:hypothetical protein SAMN04490189_3964 [Pseudomonas koreensis]|uniref:hypothetical protein n=1 Tax=Pseudomonas koreensis TaxID=198620 RepID=UPI00087A18EB|nr:hypothetical protein [Pseudomonas koreensis]KAB0515190.1 hypothetical protein F7R05_05905 [Pseudomonas koreensis]NNA60863.1 hypothetical protein [Pseudomonas koreensis]GGK24646.1 hypothetical protein GCM10009103_19860 [Pseudomonas koreensis]SDD99363.1 hypothetical protein SAMN04490189_3964 [Pseudomonas koreensis]